MDKIIPLSIKSISCHLDLLDISKCLLRGFRGRVHQLFQIVESILFKAFYIVIRKKCKLSNFRVLTKQNNFINIKSNNNYPRIR